VAPLAVDVNLAETIGVGAAAIHAQEFALKRGCTGRSGYRVRLNPFPGKKGVQNDRLPKRSSGAYRDCRSCGPFVERGTWGWKEIEPAGGKRTRSFALSSVHSAIYPPTGKCMFAVPLLRS